MAKAEDIQTVVGLFRVSTEVQEREGYSLQAQERAFARDCRAYGWRSLATFEGQETGSALTQRQTIHDLIAFIHTNRPDAIWVIEQSRLTRGDELDVAILLRELRETGTKVVTERGNVIDPADLEGAFRRTRRAGGRPASACTPAWGQSDSPGHCSSSRGKKGQADQAQSDG